MVKEPDGYDKKHKDNCGNNKSHECVDTAAGEVVDIFISTFGSCLLIVEVERDVSIRTKKRCLE